ncbi:MAG TPA: RidA family protein, partial [Rhodanobacteraceae bacterium]|nr:RidA family protein [Rhodanobacteraceae bacterium]
EQRLAKLGFELPEAPRALGSYRPAVLAGGLLFISGQLPMSNGKLAYIGRVGAELSEADGRAAAQLAALNVLAQIRAALGGFDRLLTLLRVEGHVSSAPGYFDQPRVIDAASELFSEVLGDKGAHSRAAFAPPALPRNAAIELVVIAAVE